MQGPGRQVRKGASIITTLGPCGHRCGWGASRVYPCPPDRMPTGAGSQGCRSSLNSPYISFPIWRRRSSLQTTVCSRQPKIHDGQGESALQPEILFGHGKLLSSFRFQLVMIRSPRAGLFVYLCPAPRFLLTLLLLMPNRAILLLHLQDRYAHHQGRSPCPPSACC